MALPIASGRGLRSAKVLAMDTPIDHILVVDDDPEIRHMLKQYLEKNGYQVTAVAEGRGMLLSLERGRVDLVVVDLMLPGVDGLELCRDLRARSKVPVIIPLRYGGEADIEVTDSEAAVTVTIADRGPQQGLRALLAPGGLAGARIGGHRVGSGDRPQHRPGAWWRFGAA